MVFIHRTFWLALLVLEMCAGANAAPLDSLIQTGFQAMYSLDFAASERIFAEHLRQQPDDPIGHAAQAACALFTELERLQILDAEFYVDDRKLFAETTSPPNPNVKRRIFQLTGRARQLADDLLRRDSRNEDGLFALAFANGLEADYTFLVEKSRLASAKTGRAGFEYAKRLLAVNPVFYDAYIWTGVTNYVVASLPLPIRWLAKLRGYPSSKETALNNLQIAAEKGSLLRPYAKILLVVTYLREKKTPEARAVLTALSSEFPENPLFAKHAQRLRKER